MVQLKVARTIRGLLSHMVRILQAGLVANLLILDSFLSQNRARLWVTFLIIVHPRMAEGMGDVRPLGLNACCAVSYLWILRHVT